MSDIWSQLFEATNAGKSVEIKLSESARVQPIKKPRITSGAKYGNYAAYDPSRGTRPRCQKVGCQKHLRRDQPIACSDEHAKDVQAKAEAILERIKCAA